MAVLVIVGTSLAVTVGLMRHPAPRTVLGMPGRTVEVTSTTLSTKHSWVSGSTQ